MHTTVTTYLQIFGIGLGFGFIGPCFLTCAPILITYVSGTGKTWRHAFSDVAIFLIGRLAAYSVLGILAGLSAGLIRTVVGPEAAPAFRIVAGAVSIFLAVTMIMGKRCVPGQCAAGRSPAAAWGGLLALGFLVGISPCAPLVALLFEITLMSHNAAQGLAYAFSFGLGTCIAGFVVVGSVAGILAWVPSRFVKSPHAQAVFTVLCAALLFMLGLTLIAQGWSG